MNINFRDRFIEKWNRYFGKSGLPVTFYYSDSDGGATVVQPAKAWKCLIGELARVRRGESLCYNLDSIGCGGGKRFTGMTLEVAESFRYFLSCGIPGKLEGERYKRTPEIVDEGFKSHRDLGVTGKNIIFKRWDMLTEADNPEVAIFFAHADVLSGLFTLANFDRAEQNGVFTPFGAGCSSSIYYPYLERLNDSPRAVIGMFDVSARPYVGENILTFAVPVRRLEQMVDYMDESFLITESWSRVKKRIDKHNSEH